MWRPLPHWPKRSTTACLSATRHVFFVVAVTFAPTSPTFATVVAASLVVSGLLSHGGRLGLRLGRIIGTYYQCTCCFVSRAGAFYVYAIQVAFRELIRSRLKQRKELVSDKVRLLELGFVWSQV